MIDLRSDTFMLPTPAMRAAIAEAAIGDDGYGEDPTVNRLEALTGAKLGKQAACLMPSGTMANLACILAHHPQSGGVALVGDCSDIYIYEDEGLAGRLGVRYEVLPTNRNGTIPLAAIESHLRKRPAEIGVLCLENPHNVCGGVVLPLGYLREAAELAHSHGAKLHLDGARIFNAAVKLQLDVAEIVDSADSVQFCLSKGLAAPIGSMVVGRSDFIARVRAHRRMLGGNMRQAGIIAAAGIVALEQMVERLQEDHHHIRRFAEGLAKLPGIVLDLDTVQTNTVVFRIVDKRFPSPECFIRAAWKKGTRFSDFKFGRVRAVAHCGITAFDIEQALDTVAALLNDSGPEINS
ncbi:MAG: GntG family PLP-dependent aldolase [Bryobacteraceae bacterium]